MIKKRFIIAVVTVLTGLLQAVAQNYYVEDDIYYSPDDKNPVIEQMRQEREAANPVTTVAIVSAKPDTVQSTPANYTSGIQAERDVDEYNRRYSSTSPSNSNDDGTVDGTTFAYHSDKVAAGDTLYVQLEDGYYLNDFNGSLSDYEYTVQIHRFYDPRYAVSINDPAYTTIYMLDSNDWNVYIDGSYAWVTPTWSNPWYWSYTWSPYTYSSWAWRWSWGWGSPYYGWYDPWYYPGGYYGWHSPYYHGWYDPYYAWYDPYHHHHHHHPGYYPGPHHPGGPHQPGMGGKPQPNRNDRYGGNIVSGGENGRRGTPVKDINNNRGRRISLDNPDNGRNNSVNGRRGTISNTTTRDIKGSNSERRTTGSTTINNGRRDIDSNRTTINNSSSNSSSNRTTINNSSSRRSTSSSSYTPSSSSSSRRSTSSSSYSPSRSGNSRSSVSSSRSSGGSRSSSSSSSGGRGSSGGRR